MAWIKRNLFLVIGVVVALGLLGLAGFFLYTKYSSDQAVTEELDRSTQELKTLVNRDPHPGSEQHKVDNISAAKVENKKLQSFLGEFRQHFRTLVTNQPSSREFREILDITVAELQRRAERTGVKLPEEYWFGFSAQKAAMTFPTNILGPLTAQLLDIRDLCLILFDSKIVSLEKIKRSSAGSEDGGGSTMAGMFAQDYLEAKGTTNQWAVVMPYEVTFQGFSSELANVLEALIRSKNCFVVKHLSVESADTPTTDETTGGPMYTSEGPAFNPYARYGLSQRYGGLGMGMRGMPGMPPEMMRRYGLGAPPGNPTPKPASRSGVLLEEKALRFTLTVNSVKLKATSGK